MKVKYGHKNIVKLSIIILSLICIITFVKCSFEKDEGNPKEYRPMIFINGNLYGETNKLMDNFNKDDLDYIGSVIKKVSQYNKIEEEELYSNYADIGSKIYLCDDYKNSIIVEIKHKETNDLIFVEYKKIE